MECRSRDGEYWVGKGEETDVSGWALGWSSGFRKASEGFEGTWAICTELRRFVRRLMFADPGNGLRKEIEAVSGGNKKATRPLQLCTHEVEKVVISRRSNRPHGVLPPLMESLQRSFSGPPSPDLAAVGPWRPPTRCPQRRLLIDIIRHPPIYKYIGQCIVPGSDQELGKSADPQSSILHAVPRRIPMKPTSPVLFTFISSRAKPCVANGSLNTQNGSLPSLLTIKDASFPPI